MPKNALIPISILFSSQHRAVASPTIQAGWLALMWFVVTCNIAHVALLCFWFSEAPVSVLSQASVSLAQEMCVNTMERHQEAQVLPAWPVGSCACCRWGCVVSRCCCSGHWGAQGTPPRTVPALSYCGVQPPTSMGWSFPRARWYPLGSEKLSGGSSLLPHLPNYHLYIDNLLCLNPKRFKKSWCWPATVWGLWRH